MLSALTACAKPGAPPGGPEDRLPPQVVETVPDTFAVVESFTDPIRIRFNERISERVSSGDINRAVQVSPRTGVVRVKHRRDGLEVSVAGGFEHGLVYRVTVLPVVSDMFRNQMREAFELVFSTGPEPVPNVLAGVVTDRITGRPGEGVSVVALPSGDEGAAPHVAETDSAGIYAFRYLPEGTYRIQAFQDGNRNGEADRLEPRGEAERTVGPLDTIFVHVSLLSPDTTSAIVARIEAVDSTTLRVEFDDYLDPDSSLAAVRVTVERERATSPQVVAVLHWHEYEERNDSILAPDSTGAPARAQQPAPANVGDALRARRGGVRPASGGRDALGRPLPGREAFVLLSDTLAVEVPYEVTVSGVTNIDGVGGGGGEATVLYSPPPPDTTGAAVDTTGAQPDTTGAEPDTTGVRPDTLRLVFPRRR